MAYFYASDPSYREGQFADIIANFSEQGTLIGEGNRNVVKYFNINGTNVNFKSFKEPNFINKIVYRYFRKSKARRSFENAGLLLSKGLLTPAPIAFLEYHDIMGLDSSYYICKQLDNIVELRAVISNQDYPDREKIIKAYTAQFFKMHELGIEFLDNSPGNSLVEKDGNDYKIYLVDLNRMNFKSSLSLKQRMLNFSRLTTDKEVMRMIGATYAELSNSSSNELEQMLLAASNEFRKRRLQKKQLKQKLRLLKKTIGFSAVPPAFADFI